MKARTFVVLLVALLAMSGLLMLQFSSRSNLSKTETGAPFIPGLLDQLNRIAEVQVTRAGHTVGIKAHDNGWIEAGSGYRADAGAIRELVIALSRAQISELKTRKPEGLKVLDLADTTRPSSNAVRIDLLDQAGDEIASVVVGKEKPGKGSYVRLARAQQSYLVIPKIPVRHEPVAWLDQTIVDTRSDSISEVLIRHHDGDGEQQVLLKRDDSGQLGLEDLAEGKKLRYHYALNDIVSSLARLRLAQVSRSGDKGIPGPLSGHFMFNRVRVDFNSFVLDGRIWFEFYASAEMNEQQEQADALNRRWHGWRYELDHAQYERIAKPIAELVEDEPASNDS